MPKKPLLYVDDEDINLQLFRINFSRNYEVHLASSGQQGLDIMKNHPEIRSVISDMRMPKMNGLQFISAAKERYPDTKFFILTAFEINDEIRNALKNQLIQSHLQKPLEPAAIRKALDEGNSN